MDAFKNRIAEAVLLSTHNLYLLSKYKKKMYNYFKLPWFTILIHNRYAKRINALLRSLLFFILHILRNTINNVTTNFGLYISFFVNIMKNALTICQNL